MCIDTYLKPITNSKVIAVISQFDNKVQRKDRETEPALMTLLTSVMVPSPLLKDEQSELEQEETLGVSSGDVSYASSRSLQDDIEQFDPDAVDFEPLLISGTGKILSYHSGSFHDYEGTSISVTSSVATPIATNQETDNKQKHNLCSSTRFVQLSSIIMISACMVIGGLSRFSADAGARRIQTTVVKKNSNNEVVHQRMMNVKEAVIEAASAPQIVFWDPKTSTSDNTVLLGNLMNVISQCFGRETFKLELNEQNTYELQSTSHGDSPIVSNKQNSSGNTPKAVFTSNFKQAALELFDASNPGVFVSILQDPSDMYVGQEEVGVIDNDNLLVRYLSGIEGENREVNRSDYDVARQVLQSKFVIGSCNDPSETIRRLMSMLGSTAGNDTCLQARQSWNQECEKMKERNRSDENNLQIQQQHHYDILLYDDAKNFFLSDQQSLFERDKT